MYFRMEFQSRIPLTQFSVCIGKSLKYSTQQTTVMQQKNINKYPGNFLQFFWKPGAIKSIRTGELKPSMTFVRRNFRERIRTILVQKLAKVFDYVG